MKSLIIFDLDGTLLDTVADLAASTNYALSQFNFPTHEISAYKLFIGNGINNLFERALPKGEKTAENIWEIRKHFLEYYGAHSTELTVPFPGISELLQKLQSAGFKLAVASNKYQQGTETLIQRFFPEIEFTAVFGQREGIPVKPDPTIVHDIISIAKVPANEVLYIGDSGVDMQTANNSGVDAVGVTWGFRPKAELEAFRPKYMIDKAEDVWEIVKK
jgi:phosphoglycolate phosphatase